MRTLRVATGLGVALVLATAALGCGNRGQDRGPMEQAGHDVDHAARRAERDVHHAANQAQHAVEDHDHH
jgi:hypothetical protein